MSSLTKEWLHQTIAEYEANRDELPFGLDTNSAIELQAFKLALASLEAEAAYFINRVKHSDAYGDDVELRAYCYELDALKSKDDFGGEVVPVYTAPPAPVSVPDAYIRDERGRMMLNGKPEPSIGYGGGWNACRAAMLQGADGSSPVVPDGLNIRAVAALREAVRNQWLKSDEFAEKIYWKNMHDIANEIVVAMLAAAPQQECKHEFVYGWHSYGSKSGYQCRFCGKLQEVKYCPKCEPRVSQINAFRLPDEWHFNVNTKYFIYSPSVKSDKKITFVNSSFANCSEPEGDIQFINCTLPEEWEGKVNAIDCVFKAAPQQEVK